MFAGESLTGHLPVLFLDGKPLIETNAILRRLSKRLQQYGTDEERDYGVDAVVDASEDFRCRHVAASVPCLSSIDAVTSHRHPMTGRAVDSLSASTAYCIITARLLT